MMAIVVRMPEVATGADGAAVQSWLVNTGDEVTAGQPIVEIETEKAVVEFEAHSAGVFAGALLAAGETAPVGAPIAVIATEGQSIAEAMNEAGCVPTDPSTPLADSAMRPSEAPAGPAIPKPPATSESGATPDSGAVVTARRLFTSPLVRKLARARGIDLLRVTGTGPNGRIVRRDLDALPETAADTMSEASAPPTAVPTADTGAHSSFQDIPHTGMRRAIARRLSQSKSTAPHFYLRADCRVDELLAMRQQLNAQGNQRISVNDLVIKATAWALRDVPEANGIWTDDAHRRFSRVDLAVAVSVPSGLLTPVVRNAGDISISELSTTMRDLAERAREGRLKQRELEGGSFAVTNLGMYGTREFSAIINPPHAGILAVGAAEPRPVVDTHGELAVATVMTVTLSADHRVLDGALAAQWLAAFQRRIEHPLSLLI